ncbi:hypothetical protein EVAR_13921_1 [Eumeta japonica]|uniref:Uncharacterized protein n=1 Tax=Eumeta variegata TaxID=151549 RepID=A0A4C1U8G2_EUMVA|nr:hypothetical protein EVAR_13921_1 [Eumeta japonica]
MHRDSDKVCKAIKQTYQFQHCFGYTKYKDTYRRVGGTPTETMLKLRNCLGEHFVPPLPTVTARSEIRLWEGAPRRWSNRTLAQALVKYGCRTEKIFETLKN